MIFHQSDLSEYLKNKNLGLCDYNPPLEKDLSGNASAKFADLSLFEFALRIKEGVIKLAKNRDYSVFIYGWL